MTTSAPRKQQDHLDWTDWPRCNRSNAIEFQSCCLTWDDDPFDLPHPRNFAVPFSIVLENAKQLSLFVDIDTEILGGTPRIDGTRIPVYMVLNAIEEHGSIQGAVNAYRSSL